MKTVQINVEARVYVDTGNRNSARPVFGNTLDECQRVAELLRDAQPWSFVYVLLVEPPITTFIHGRP